MLEPLTLTVAPGATFVSGSMTSPEGGGGGVLVPGADVVAGAVVAGPVVVPGAEVVAGLAVVGGDVVAGGAVVAGPPAAKVYAPTTWTAAPLDATSPTAMPHGSVAGGTGIQDRLEFPMPDVRVGKLVAGSWVYGTLSTWIGDHAKNRAWDLLCQAKADFDRVMAEGRLAPEVAERAREQLAICEGSDWFWWFGDYNPAESVADFDRLYRTHLKNLYRFLGEPAPAALEQVISRGGGQQENDGVMRRGQG